MAFFTKDFLQFFIELVPNNNKDWFDLNRKRYEQNIKNPFKHFVQLLIDRLAEQDVVFKDLEAKENSLTSQNSADRISIFIF